jgi:hypothetical protein
MYAMLQYAVGAESSQQAPQPPAPAFAAHPTSRYSSYGPVVSAPGARVALLLDDALATAAAAAASDDDANSRATATAAGSGSSGGGSNGVIFLESVADLSKEVRGIMCMHIYICIMNCYIHTSKCVYYLHAYMCTYYTYTHTHRCCAWLGRGLCGSWTRPRWPQPLYSPEGLQQEL